MAEAEKDPRKKAILMRMAEAEERHAARWEKKMADFGAPLPTWQDSVGKRLSRWFNRLAGTDIAIRRQEAAEDRDKSRYEAQQRARPGRGCRSETDPEGDRARREGARQSAAADRAATGPAHYARCHSQARTLARPRRLWVADAIYGVNDGLGSVFGIVSGVAGATNNQQHYVLIAGLAGMIASALSMGAGAWLAVKSEREVYEAEISRERAEVEENPEEETEEMALFYELQGFDRDDARRMAERLAANPEQMVRAMAQSELGLSEHHFPNPWISSLSAALSTAVGAFIPIIPFFFLGGFTAVVVAFAVSIVAHFAVGAAKSLITTRSWWASGIEMTLVGILEAAVTYTLGLAVGGIG